MKNILYSVWNDIKKSKLFTMLFCIEIFAVIIIVATFMTSTLVENNYLSLYDKNNSDLVLVDVNINSDFKKNDGKKGFEKSAYGVTSYIDEGAIAIINSNAAEYFEVKHTGKWFSGDETTEYSETLVSPTLKNKYKIDGTYMLPVGNNVEYKIKVVGYLDSRDTAITLSASSCDGVYGERKIMICDGRLIDKAMVDCVVTKGENTRFYADNYNFNAVTLGDSYQQYEVDTKESRHYASLILGLLFSIVSVCILCNSIFKTEYDIKRNMIKFVVGNSNKNIIIGEEIKCFMIYIIPFLLALGITAAINVSAIVSKTVSIISWKNFIISASIVLLVYILATIFSLIRVITAKPLKELRRI